MGENFFAQTGATSDGYDLTGAKSLPSIEEQIKNHPEAMKNADIVTLTAGGNDILFGKVVRECVNVLGTEAGCIAQVQESSNLIKSGNQVTQAATQVDKNNLASELEKLYKTALEASPNATIFVSGYPTIVRGDLGSDSMLGISANRAKELEKLGIELNDVIKATIDKVNAESPTGPRLLYMDASNVFPKENSLNSYNSAVNLLSISRTVGELASYHPNALGNRLWGAEVGKFIRGEK